VAVSVLTPSQVESLRSQNLASSTRITRDIPDGFPSPTSEIISNNDQDHVSKPQWIMFWRFRLPPTLTANLAPPHGKIIKLGALTAWPEWLRSARPRPPWPPRRASRGIYNDLMWEKSMV
jgi:hypothetical protein